MIFHEYIVRNAKFKAFLKVLGMVIGKTLFHHAVLYFELVKTSCIFEKIKDTNLNKRTLYLTANAKKKAIQFSKV